MVKQVCMHAALPCIIILSKTIDARLRADVFSWGVARQDVIMIERGAVAQYFTAYSDELFDAFPKLQVPRQVTGGQIANALAENNKSFAYDIETGANNGVALCRCAHSCPDTTERAAGVGAACHTELLQLLLLPAAAAEYTSGGPQLLLSVSGSMISS